MLCYFFFQAEDGIRDATVTGVQTCALPISCCPELRALFGLGKLAVLFNTGTLVYPMTKTQYNSNPFQRPPQLFSHADQVTQWRSEERRVGKECRSRLWS